MPTLASKLARCRGIRRMLLRSNVPACVQAPRENLTHIIYKDMREVFLCHLLYWMLAMAV